MQLVRGTTYIEVYGGAKTAEEHFTKKFWRSRMKDSYNVAVAIHIALTDTINAPQISPSLYEKELALRQYGNNPSAHKDAVIEALKQYRDIFDNAIKDLENAE